MKNKHCCAQQYRWASWALHRIEDERGEQRVLDRLTPGFKTRGNKTMVSGVKPVFIREGRGFWGTVKILFCDRYRWYLSAQISMCLHFFPTNAYFRESKHIKTRLFYCALWSYVHIPMTGDGSFHPSSPLPLSLSFSLSPFLPFSFLLYFLIHLQQT